jgi:hypothetical protein
MARWLALLVVLGISMPALADPSVGVVVTGDETVRSAGIYSVETWLGKHNFSIAMSPLDKDALLTVTNCLAISDIACARGVVEKRSKADTLVIIVAQSSGSAKKRDIQLSAYWMTKNHDVISLQKMCNHCTKDVVSPTLEALMSDLSKLVPSMTGKLEVTSEPKGMLVTVDNEAIGVTPVTKDVTPGTHEVALSRDGKVSDKKTATITAGEVTKLELVGPALPEHADDGDRPLPPAKHSRTIPVVLIGVGLAGVATGAVMYAISGPTGDSYYYNDLQPPGIGIAIGGGAVAVAGTIWFLAGGKSSSTPTVAVTPSHAYVGWAGRF